jgi:formate dehydrogenase subunit delta
MDGHKLVKMANQIAAAFGADPDRKVAVESTAGHLKRFWEPRMRREILAVLDRGGDHGMSPIVVEALQLHRKTLDPAAN